MLLSPTSTSSSARERQFEIQNEDKSGSLSPNQSLKYIILEELNNNGALVRREIATTANGLSWKETVNDEQAAVIVESIRRQTGVTVICK